MRHRLISPKSRRRRVDDYKHWERSRSRELWQIDVMGAAPADGARISVVIGIDDHSRYCVIVKVVALATARPDCDALLDGLARHADTNDIIVTVAGSAQRSTDGGETWQPVEIPAGASMIEFSPDDPETPYAAVHEDPNRASGSAPTTPQTWEKL